jgi:uncharacterized protein
MITLSVMGVNVSIFLLVFIGLAVGILSGFVGVGGGYLMTPALIVLGLPANIAVGTSMAWLVGNSIVGSLKHYQLGNVDIKLGLLIMIGAVGGVEFGVHLLNLTKGTGLSDTIILSVLIIMLVAIGSSTFREIQRRRAQLDEILKSKGELPPAVRLSSMGRRLHSLVIPPVVHFAKSEVTLSLWVILAIGFVTGTLAGFLGVGGGFVILPSLIYLIGVPSFMAVGTSIFQIIFPACFGCIRHTMSGNVIILIAFLILLGSSIGTQFGALITQRVRGIAMRYVLVISIILCVVGSILKLINVILPVPIAWLQLAAVGATFGGMGLVIVMIAALYVIAIRYRRGQHVPAWVIFLVAKDD